MKDRIKKLRKILDMTQQEFADRIGVKRNTIGQYEIGRNEPIDAVTSLICREFDVREEWLRTGEGEMFKPKPSDVLDQLAYKYKLFNFDYVMIEKFLAMPPDLRRAIYDHFHDVDAALSEMNPYAPAYAGTEPPQPMDDVVDSFQKLKNKNLTANRTMQEMSREEIHAELDRQLDAEKEAAAKSEVS
ncbi:MAG: helix-turn-helix domain-containing protein [Lachnospiraceae bacterium]|nr:helix-turn-helix domain-containing protein [Lachnospiraceae bacterium]